MIIVMGLTCLLSNLMFIWYRHILKKSNETFQLTIKETIILSVSSLFVQIVLFVSNKNLAVMGCYIPYLLIQGYTDYKTGYVYRKPSIVIGIIALIYTILTIRDIHIPSFIISMMTLGFFVGGSLFKVLGWGDTITIGVVIIALLPILRSSFIPFWLVVIFFTSLSFSIYTLCFRKKTAPFLPHFTSVIITVLMICALFF